LCHDGELVGLLGVCEGGSVVAEGKGFDLGLLRGFLVLRGGLVL